MAEKSNTLKVKAENISKLASGFFGQYGLDDYAEFANDIAMRLYRKHSKPLQRGNEQIWAAAIVYALASVNDVLQMKDKKFSSDDIANYFNLDKNKIARKAYAIKDMLKLDKDDTYLSQNYINKLKIIETHLKEFTKKLKEATDKKEDKNIVLKFELQGFPSYRKMVVPYIFKLEEVASFTTLSFFTDDIFVPFSISTDNNNIILNPDNPSKITIGDLLKSPGNSCIVKYEPSWEVKVIFEKFYDDNSSSIFYIDSEGPLIPVGANTPREMDLLVSDETTLREHIKGIYQPMTKEQTDKVIQTILRPDTKYFNYVIQRSFLDF